MISFGKLDQQMTNQNLSSLFSGKLLRASSKILRPDIVRSPHKWE